MDILFLVLFICTALIVIGAFSWREEVVHFFGSLWLKLVIVKDVCLGKARFSDLSDTAEYREWRALLAQSEMEEFFHSPDLAQYVAKNQGNAGPHKTFLWRFGEEEYSIDLLGREVTLTHKQFTLPSSIAEALDRYRSERPDYDPYTSFILRLSDPRHILEDSARYP